MCVPFSCATLYVRAAGSAARRRCIGNAWKFDALHVVETNTLLPVNIDLSVFNTTDDYKIQTTSDVQGT